MYPLISVIVPIYKVEKYLSKCIDSILNQEYQNIEIFLVDDGSPDSCGSLCDEYLSKDHRIKVIHKTNGGLSDARNVALDIMTGEYVTFIDSDDFVSSTYILTLWNIIAVPLKSQNAL
jgi:Glycosyltransferases involved in cell wall biogenesis